VGVTREAAERSAGGRTAPAWLTWAVAAALVAVYTGERIVPETAAARIVLSGGGVLLLLAAVGLRAVSWRRASGDARAVERLFLLTYLGCALALALFLLAGGGARWLGVGPADPTARARFETALLVLGCIVLAASLLPALAAQWAAGAGQGGPGSSGAVDRLRVTQLATAGLTVALALPFLMLTGWVASERNRTLDVSYFRTSSPGSATEQIVRSLDAPLRVLLFFPPVNEVKDQVREYFRALAAAGGNVRVEEHDLLASPLVAAEHGIVRDGTIVFAVGERSERIALPTVLREARLQLRNLDRTAQQALMRVARDARTVYLTVGHGELNDPGSARAVDTLALGSVYALQSIFGYLNFDVRDLGLQSGLGRDVPDDAAMVLVLGPRRAFLEPELQTLDRYLARGGSVLLALEPESEFVLGPLRDRLGVDFRPTPLADDQQYIPFRGNVSDRRFLVTDRVFSHESLPTVSQAGIGDGMAFLGAGYLEPTEADRPRVTVVVRSMPSTFADATPDFELGPGEERLQYPLVVAAEWGRQEPGEVSGGEMRAMVFADSDLFADMILAQVGLNGALVADAIRWLGREEELAGETVSEADIPIVHTRAKDVAWFYSTILGAPSLVLILGLTLVKRRRGRQTTRET
jgi:hypothetical protein